MDEQCRRVVRVEDRSEKMSEKKPVCEICGVSLPECGSFVQCAILHGFVCSSCHWNCLHHCIAGSITWCGAAYAETKK